MIFRKISIIFIIFKLTSLLGQTNPQVDDLYKQYIIHYNHRETPNILNSFLSKYLSNGEKDVNRRSFAIVAGVSKYNSSRINNLPPAENDINNLVAYLRDTQKFDEIIVLKNKNVDVNNLSYFLTNYLPKRFRKFKKSKFLFAYSGHGSQNNKNTRGYLVKSNALNIEDRANSISLKVLSAWLDETVSDSFQSLVLINSCYGGHFVNIPISFGNEDGYTSRRGHHVITAGGSNQQVFAKDNSSGSYFFDILLEGLKTGRSDSGPNGNDGIITTREIMAHLESRSPHVFQIPKLGGLVPNNENNGYFYFYNTDSKIVSDNRSKKNLSLSHFSINFGDEKKSIKIFENLDSDGDGILDSVDKCPNKFGSIENLGCPNKNMTNQSSYNSVSEKPIVKSYPSKGNTQTRMIAKLRTDPTPVAKVIIRIPKGAKVQIVHKEEDYWKVKYANWTGYLNEMYLDQTSQLSYDNISEKSNAKIYSSKGDTRTKMIAKLRSSPNPLAKIIIKIPKGAKVETVYKEGGYWKVKYATWEGYLNEIYIEQ